MPKPNATPSGRHSQVTNWLTKPETELIDTLVKTGLFGTNRTEVVRNLARQRLLQLIQESNLPILVTA